MLTWKTRSFAFNVIQKVDLLVNKPVHDCNQEVDWKFVYHERQYPSIKACFKSVVWLRRSFDALAGTRESVADKCLNPSPSGAVLSVPTVAGDKNGI